MKYSITQEARWKHKSLTKIKKYREKGDKNAVNRVAGYLCIGLIKSIYDRQKKWGGTWQSLLPGSHKPHSHPKKHTEDEIKMIIKVYREI